MGSGGRVSQKIAPKDPDRRITGTHHYPCRGSQTETSGTKQTNLTRLKCIEIIQTIDAYIREL